MGWTSDDYERSIGLKGGQELRNPGSDNARFRADLQNSQYQATARQLGIKSLDSANDLAKVISHLNSQKQSASPVTPSGAGGSSAAQATTATKDRAEASYRESLPATTPKQNPWVPLKFGGGTGDEAHNSQARSNNANLATQGMLDAARATQESTTKSADRFDAMAFNSSQWMADIDSRNMSALSPNLALPKNPTEALQGFYGDISDKMKGYL
jgi:hypothetical protein